MNKYVKGAFIFTGGMVVGAGVIGGLVLSSKDIRKVICKKIADALVHGYEQLYYVEDVIISDRKEAEKILDDMKAILSEYGIVRLSDYKDLCGFVPYHADHKFGWIKLDDAEVIEVEHGFTIKLPRLADIK